jgi:hypothetical protein
MLCEEYSLAIVQSRRRRRRRRRRRVFLGTSLVRARLILSSLFYKNFVFSFKLKDLNKTSNALSNQ